MEVLFLLSFLGEEIVDVNDVIKSELVGWDNIKLESIMCFFGGFVLKLNKWIENNMVLFFKFLVYVMCIFDVKSIEVWLKVVEWLKNI